MSTAANTTTAPFPAADVAAAVARGLVAANDRPQTLLDATRTPQRYAEAETVKDISAQHGGFIHTHYAIMSVVSELARLVDNSGDPATARWITITFQAARDLHSNFYEDELPENMVIGGVMQCEELADFLRRRFGLA